MDFAQLNRRRHGERRFTCRLVWAPWLAGLLVCSTLWLTPARAVDPQPDDVTDLSLEDLRRVQVYSASMYLQDDRQAPSSVTVVTAEEIRKCGYRTLADIFRSVRGFYVSYDRNYSYVGVRGFSRPGDYNTRILLLLNGHRLTDNLYNSALIGTDFQLDVDLIDRVEIVRGPSSSLYGTNAFFAVVNVITSDVHHFQGMALAGETDGFGTYKGRSTYGQRLHGVDLFLSGTAYDSGGPARLFFPAFDSPSTNYGYALHADHDSSGSFFGRLSFGHFTLESAGSTREKQIPTAAFNTLFGDPRTHTVDDRGYLDLKYARTLQENAELTARISFDRVTYHGVYANESADETGSKLNHDFGRGDWADIEVKITKQQLRRPAGGVGTAGEPVGQAARGQEGLGSRSPSASRGEESGGGGPDRRAPTPAGE